MCICGVFLAHEKQQNACHSESTTLISQNAEPQGTTNTVQSPVSENQQIIPDDTESLKSTDISMMDAFSESDEETSDSSDDSGTLSEDDQNPQISNVPEKDEVSDNYLNEEFNQDDFPFILLNNRDEFLSRPTSVIQFWKNFSFDDDHEKELEKIDFCDQKDFSLKDFGNCLHLMAIDEISKGTWGGLNLQNGNFSFLTNVEKDPGDVIPVGVDLVERFSCQSFPPNNEKSHQNSNEEKVPQLSRGMINKYLLTLPKPFVFNGNLKEKAENFEKVACFILKPGFNYYNVLFGNVFQFFLEKSSEKKLFFFSKNQENFCRKSDLKDDILYLSREISNFPKKSENNSKKADEIFIYSNSIVPNDPHWPKIQILKKEMEKQFILSEKVEKNGVDNFELQSFKLIVSKSTLQTSAMSSLLPAKNFDHSRISRMLQKCEKCLNLTPNFDENTVFSEFFKFPEFFERTEKDLENEKNCKINDLQIEKEEKFFEQRKNCLKNLEKSVILDPKNSDSKNGMFEIMRNVFCEVFSPENSKLFHQYWNNSKKPEKIKNDPKDEEKNGKILKKPEIPRKKLVFKTRSQTVLFVDLKTESLFYCYRNSENFSPNIETKQKIEEFFVSKTSDEEEDFETKTMKEIQKNFGASNCKWQVFQFNICFDK